MFLAAFIPRTLVVIMLLGSLCACVPATGLESTFPREKEMTNTIQLITQETEAILSAADRAAESNDWILANTLLKKGLDTLGAQYVSPSTIDDTGMKLVLAGAEEQKGSFQVAAMIRRRVLLARLSLFREKGAVCTK